MKLNESINLIVHVGDLQAYHTPISREVFEANYRVLAATKAAISSKGVFYQMDAGPRIASLALKDEARKDAEDRGDIDEAGKPRSDAAQALLAEIRRLTVILCPSAKGWETLPVDSAIASGKIDADDWREAESGIIFFTCLWSLASKQDRSRVAMASAGLLKGSTTSCSPSEFVASLQQSTNPTPSTAAGSAVPS